MDAAPPPDAALTDEADAAAVQASVRAVLLDDLGVLAGEENEHLRDWLDPAFVRQEHEKLQAQRWWLWGLALAMVLLAVALPTGALYRFVTETDQITTTQFLAQTGAWCAYAGVQTAVAVYLVQRWRHRLATYRALRALATSGDAEPAPPPRSPSSGA